MHEQTDVGTRVLDFIFKKMMIDADYSEWQGRSFTWWPHRVAQRLWAEPGRSEGGFTVCKVHAESDLLRDVQASEIVFETLNYLNQQSTLSRFIFDSEQGKIRMASCAYFHPENADWLSALFTHAAALQIATAHRLIDSVSGLLDYPVDESFSPSGEREEPDDMLNVLGLYSGVGEGPSAFIGEECLAIERMKPAPFLLANARQNGATVEFPYPEGMPATALLTIHADVRNPVLGSGVLLLLKKPHVDGVPASAERINRLNQDEMKEWTRSNGFGAWCTDPHRPQDLTYVCFLPSMTKEKGLLQNQVYQMAARTTWLRGHLDS